MKKLLLALSLAAAAPALAQSSAPTFTLSCEGRKPDHALQQQQCELREMQLTAPPAGTPLTIDAVANGSITVRGWEGATVRVRARVEGRAATMEAARALANAVKISTTGNTIRAARANNSLDNWEVGYEVLVPAQTSLTLKATNGHIRIENVEGAIRFETTNGSITLQGLAGDVRGKTTNGGITLGLTGTTWTRGGLDVSTVNGGITWQIPATYAATIMARTVHGRVTAALAAGARKSLLAHNLTATLGAGGPQLRVATVSGGISVTQEGSGQ